MNPIIYQIHLGYIEVCMRKSLRIFEINPKFPRFFLISYKSSLQTLNYQCSLIEFNLHKVWSVSSLKFN